MPDSINNTASIQTKTTFGVPSLTRPTPAWAQNIGNGVLYGLAIVNIVLVSFPQIPHDLKGSIAQYSLEAAAAVKAICALFGIQLVDSQNLPNKN